MHKQGEEVHLTDTEASGGSKEGVVRWVLAGGLLLAIILLSVTWIIPALSTGDAMQRGSGEPPARPLKTCPAATLAMLRDGALLVKGALACRDDNSAPARNRRLLATYFAAAHLPETAALRAQVEGLAASVLAFEPTA